MGLNDYYTKKDRARKIVKMAAEQVDNTFVKHWLEYDEKGTWEKNALELLSLLEELPKAQQLTEEEQDQEIATNLAYAGLQVTTKVMDKEANG